MALTDTAIRNAKPKEKPYKVTDSLGLYLLVNPRGGKLWRIKYRINGSERKLSVGAYPDITLSEASARVMQPAGNYPGLSCSSLSRYVAVVSSLTTSLWLSSNV
ncbi:Arm DNA-binding domain-containing protein [Novosphingobium sp.]|uniref:Arm DNA-binding domain-containing protein n=1 Tax=Novosphingobium sp. TaxID=1874826 RepID=UPI003D151E18